eukprot:TRINITY_DN1011_c0_g1_i1.p1 TRINITY_DN1011_c0_g1~~TRINITY_DN1011_c0_g1_i1.p1  ORF type:complete len:182 (-),score=58.23 TRINITY_DN1011_c0_g1_i1:494-1039(-)
MDVVAGQLYAEKEDETELKEPAKSEPSLVRKRVPSIENVGEAVKPEEAGLSEKRRALFEPLTVSTSTRGRSTESLLPPPDFDSASYPKGWVVGKKRKLVNVDVVESMRRVAILEMNRKDREIDGLNEQLEEDARCLEHLQQQLLQERSKRAEVERENVALQNQINILMEMIQEHDEPVDAS